MVSIVVVLVWYLMLILNMGVLNMGVFLAVNS